MGIGVIYLGGDPHLPLILATFIAIIVARRWGYSTFDIEKFIRTGVQDSIIPILVLISVSIMIGIWIASGVVPTLISYGLHILRPSGFLLTATILCTITTVATGSSWSTVGTVGLAILAVGKLLGLPEGIVAGAVISGAYAGDKISPLSDTTILAAASTSTKLFTHVRYMLLPTLLAYSVALAGYAYISFTSETKQFDNRELVQLQNLLSDKFFIHPLMLLPLILMTYLVIKKYHSLLIIWLGIFSAAILGLLSNQTTTAELFQLTYGGYVSKSGNTAIDTLLSKGGINSVMYGVSTYIIIVVFSSVLEGSGQIKLLLTSLEKRARRTSSIVGCTLLASFFTNICVGDQYMSIILPGKIFSPLYRSRNIHPKVLSCSLESAGTVTSPLIPWTTCAIYMSSVLGISTASYAPYAFFGIVSPIVFYLMVLCSNSVPSIDDDPNGIEFNTEILG